ncbi:MAG: sigma-70 family RNA polymerase sigma factor [Lachnospiraceae bacterium]|nr:sigma-70 family RNA polymerase sigma factor [Lachnospiraceae bacterium]
MFFNKIEEAKRKIVEQIILEKYNQYYRTAYSYVRNEADACDIVQNGAYRALRGSNTLKKPEYASTWVYRIMLNECFRYMRQPQNISYEQMQDEMGMEPFYTEDGSEKIDIRRVLDSLPEQDKAVIILRFFEDMKLEEIADILEENLSTVKSRLYRSIKKLRSVLGEDI